MVFQLITYLVGKSSGSHLAAPRRFHARMVRRRIRSGYVGTGVHQIRDHSHNGIASHCVRMCPRSDMATRRRDLFPLGTFCLRNLKVQVRKRQLKACQRDDNRMLVPCLSNRYCTPGARTAGTTSLSEYRLLVQV